LTWLGQSLIVLSCPLAFGLAIHAVSNGTDRRAGFFALGLSGLEMLLVWLPYAMVIFGLGDFWNQVMGKLHGYY
jgi:hypothetical protein